MMTKTNFYRQLSVTVLLILLTTVAFWLFPTIDLDVSGFFYQTNTFLFHNVTIFRRMPHLINWALIITSVVLLTGLILSTTQKRLHCYHKQFCFLFLCFLLGPGLLVNGILKTHWGRPRPQNVTYFDGKHTYQKVWMISDACDHNCSFVCGDCAAMFCFVSLAFIARRKKLVAMIAVLQASFFSFLRLGLGKHFLSDIMLAWELVYLVILLVYFGVFLRKTNCKTK